MEALKEMFNPAFYRHFAGVFDKVDKNFNADKFVKEATVGLADLSLNERLRKTAITLRQNLPSNYKKAVNILFRAAPDLPKGYTALVLPDFVGLYGKEHFDLSMDALRYFTPFGSSEFAIRVFLKDELHKTLQVMNQWAGDKDFHVRRLASEGSRPRLPWSFRLDEFIKKPALTRSILEKLKADEQLYVRKSVANHLNDISKDNAVYMLQLIREWDIANVHTRWIIKHACRSLIKKGQKDSLALFSFEKNARVALSAFRLSAYRLSIGGALTFSFDLTGEKSSAQKLAVDYAVHYTKSSGLSSRKVFKLKEFTLGPRQTVHIEKKQGFKDLTTRKHYPGKHSIEIIVNGKIMGEQTFQLS